MDILVSLTDEERAAILAELGEGATDAMATEVVQQGGRMRIDEIVARQRQYQLDRAVARLKTVLAKLVQLTPDQQNEVQVIAEAAIDERLAANAAAPPA